MAKIGKRFIAVEDNSGKRHSFECNVHVDAAGIFQFEFPQDMRATAENLVRGWHSKNERKKVFVSEPKKGNAVRLCGPDQVEVEAALKDITVHHHQVAIREEFVIRYRLDSHYCAVKLADGGFVPNGQYAPEGDYAKEKAKFVGDKAGRQFMERKEDFRLQVYAKVWLKTTVTRGDSEEILWRQDWGDFTPTVERGVALGPNARRLNDTLGLLREWSEFRNSRNTLDECEEIPYTEDAAMFFSDLLMAIARLSHSVEFFVGDKAQLMHAIENRASPLMLGHKAG